jgi:hypothetical protein
MTGQLRNLLEERADSVAFAPPDVRDIVAEAERRVRRRRSRRLVGSAAALALVVLVGGGITALSALRHPSDVSTGGGLADPVTWSRGSVIHAGPDRIDVGFTIHGFVRTSSGFVLMDVGRGVWSVTDGRRERVGEVGEQRRVVADRNGTLAAWIDPGSTLVVHDQVAGTTRSFPDPGGRVDGAGVLAMDGDVVYWRSSRGLVKVDLATGAVTPLTTGRIQLFDAKNAVLAFADATRDLKVGHSLQDASPLVAWSLDPHGGDEPVVLSPTGRWAAVAHIRVTGPGDDPDIDAHLNVYDVRMRAPTTLRLPGGPWVAVPSVWLGDATIQVLGLFGDPPFEGDTVDPTLFTCSMPSGRCKRAATVGRVGAGYAVATLPDGRFTGE